MSYDLLVGARGWLHPEWDGQFYSEDLPDDWRFCYYSNLVRSVLVPAEMWDETGPAQVRQWHEDSDPGFRFVHELPAGLSRAQPADALGRQAQAFVETVAPVAERTAGLLGRLGPAADLDWLAALIDALAGRYPLCLELDLPQWPRETAALLTERGVGLCWHPEHEAQPAAGGSFLVALMGRADLKQTRTVVERLAEWMGKERVAALFFDEPATSATQARDARILAELLGA